MLVLLSENLFRLTQIKTEVSVQTSVATGYSYEERLERIHAAQEKGDPTGRVLEKTSR